MATGDRKCFNVTIIDDGELEQTYESFYFTVDALNTSLRNNHFFDQFRIYVYDNEGQTNVTFMVVKIMAE